MVTHQLPLPNAAREMQRLDHQLCFALYSSSLLMTKLYKPVLTPLGLTYPQYLVLLVLWERDAIAVGELGARLYLDSGTLTPLLKRMQTAGLLTRTRATDDERRVIVTLTPAGRALRRKAEQVPLTVACASGCTLTELTTLTAQLQALRGNVANHLTLAAA
ncbi:MAG TPA: MarR family transcriptional regulator [Burkholderiaceae bacterium]|jgi:DNA-binding MarR family transcriptional regulator